MRDTLLPFGDVVPVPALDTLSVAKGELFERERFRAGSECPCCGQFVKLYRRKFNANMAVFMISLVRAYDGEPVHIRQLNYTGRDYAWVAFWELAATPSREDGDAGRTSGTWYPTELGADFVHGLSRVPAAKWIFDGNEFTVSGDPEPYISIREALGERFNYEELMRGTAKGASHA